MRLVLLAALALLAVPASAQSRFVASCVASAESGEALPFEPATVCQCAADATLARGIAAADLDGLIDFVGEDQTFDSEAMPEAARAVAALAIESLLGCALQANPDALAALTAASARPTEAIPSGPLTVEPGTAMPMPRPPNGQAGIRLGGGPAPTRTEQSGPGAAIRILG